MFSAGENEYHGTATDLAELDEAIRGCANAEAPDDIPGQQRYFSRDLPRLIARAKEILATLFDERELAAIAVLCAELCDGEFRSAEELDDMNNQETFDERTRNRPIDGRGADDL